MRIHFKHRKGDALTCYAESRLDTHDLEIPFGAAVDPQMGTTLSGRRLRVLLLSPTAVTDETMQEIFNRIQRFASLTGGRDLAIVYLLCSPPHTAFLSAKQLASGALDEATSVDAAYGYSKLQAEMINRADIPHIPILPLPNLESLSQVLEQHVANLSRISPKHKASATTFELLQLCTANPPMPLQTAYVLSDIFTTLDDLAAACSTVTSAPNSSSPSARAAGESSQMSDVYDLGMGMSTQSSDATNKLKRLRDIVGDQQCRDIVDFWKEEWTID